ncbi:hypothetical protein IJH89_00985 [Candidatus Saccharibacteria bacterium]|nr:hypothetical protein [Candidatus Saccharibacteria bacterium]
MPNNKKSLSNSKTLTSSRPRVLVNTFLLLIATIVSGVLTFRAFQISQNASKMLSHYALSDSPALCFDSPSSTIREHGYICTTEHDPATDKNVSVGDDVQQLTLYLNDRITFSGAISNSYLGIALTYLGAIITLLELVITIVYFNHNRK